MIRPCQAKGTRSSIKYLDTRLFQTGVNPQHFRQDIGCSKRKHCQRSLLAHPSVGNLIERTISAAYKNQIVIPFTYSFGKSRRFSILLCGKPVRCYLQIPQYNLKPWSPGPISSTPAGSRVYKNGHPPIFGKNRRSQKHPHASEIYFHH